MKSDFADGKRSLQSNEKFEEVIEDPTEWKIFRNYRNQKKIRGRDGRKNTFASEERYASRRNRQLRRRRSPSPESCGSRSTSPELDTRCGMFYRCKGPLERGLNPLTSHNRSYNSLVDNRNYRPRTDHSSEYED